MPTWDFDADFEAGDTSEFTSVSGTPTASAGSKKNGSYGCEFTVDGTTAEYGTFIGGELSSDTSVMAECWVDPNGVTVSSSDIIFMYMTNDAGSVGIVNARLVYTGGAYYVRFGYRNDSGGNTTSSSYAITDDYHKVRLVWKASTGAGNNDGWVHLIVDGVYATSLSGLDTDTLTVGRVRFGYTYGTADNSGTIYLDDCKVADEAYGSVGSGGLTPSGAFNKKTNRGFTGAVSTITGSLAKRLGKVLAGTVSTITGAYSYICTFASAISATVASVGELISRLNGVVMKALAGAITPSSEIVKASQFYIVALAMDLTTRATDLTLTARKRDYELNTRGRGDY